ncbi:helix-turn-helix transcriptional regulator [Rhodanobacter sp. L36]|uniref:helix-turn-helix transcriptional regulator n=1 Tax=Rhodanobacter sp. L36 TaxID=1747221 RepID=UPI001C202AC6|nr:helix-turn-helix transcriptional regulator [Rhodanobacter sp. L36]
MFYSDYFTKVDATVVRDHLDDLREKTSWIDREYREAYAVAAVEQGIAWQIRINRERRGLRQSDLAKKIGTNQAGVSRIEDPEYGRHSIPQLLKLAQAFDCALIVKLAPYSCLARESNSLSADELYAASFDEEIQGE